MCARRRSPFLCLAKERNQRKATPLRVSPTLRFGATCGTQSRGGTAELTSLLRSSVQTTAVSQSTKRMHPAVHAPAPRPALLGTRRGVVEPQRAIAALGPQGAGASRRVCGAVRSDGPFGIPPCGCACGAGLAGWRVQRSMHALRRLTRRGCLNAAPQARSEFCGAPRKARDAGLPRSAAKGSQTWGRFLCLLSCAHKKVGRPPGRTPGLRRQINNRRQPHTR